MKTFHCSKFSEEDLIALELGELSALRSVAVRRHLAHCPDCAAAASEIAVARAQTRALTPAIARAPDALRDRIWRNAPIASAPTNAPRRVFVGRLVLGVGASVAVIAAVTLLPGTMGHPTLAFAQVEQAMSEIKTVTWEETYENSPSFYRGGKVDFHSSKRPVIYWARFDPATLTEYWSMGRSVYNDSGTYQIVPNKGGVPTYSHYTSGIPGGTFFGASKAQTSAEKLRDAIIFRLPKDEDAPQTESRNAGSMERKPIVSAEETLNGRKVIRFVGELHVPPKPPANPEFPWRTSGEKWVYWVDPQSYRIVQRDVHTFFTNGSREIEEVERRKNFRYNFTPPAEAFEYLPAVGSRYTYAPLRERPATPDENRRLESVIRPALDAWNRGDSAAYLNAWDFEYISATPEEAGHNRRLQLKYMTDGRPFRKWRILDFTPAWARVSGQFIQHTPETPFPPTEPSEFATILHVEGTDANGKKHEERLNIHVRRDGGDYRIIRAYWNWILNKKR